MSATSFGYLTNEKLCSCGRHYGIGEISPEDRAARAARFRETFPELMPYEMKAFLEDWERHHGGVVYHMAVLAVNSGEFNKKSKKKDVWGAVYGAAYQGTEDLFRQRADIHG